MDTPYRALQLEMVSSKFEEQTDLILCPQGSNTCSLGSTGPLFMILNI